MEKASVFVDSEIAPLRRVLVHRPDQGISRISPRRAEELLFDDIVYLPQMQKEHDIFTAVLGAFLGSGNVLEVQNLLAEALSFDEAAKITMINQIIDYEELPSSTQDLFLRLDNHTLADVLISGYFEDEDYILFDPIPNFIFTRDIAVTINDHILITKAAKEARYRENFLTRFVIWAHPIFRALRKAGRMINLNDVERFPPSRKGESVSLEGGDAMMLRKDFLLIGLSERTNRHGIHSLRDFLFRKGLVENVVLMNVPADRSFMHLDTIFTQIHHHHIVAFKPIVLEGLSSAVEVYRRNGTLDYYSTIAAFLQKEINPQMEFILSGQGESPYQEREQWTDGCNLVAIRPGVALTYDRNTVTERAFRQAGYEILPAQQFLDQVSAGNLDPQTVENTIITLPSNELSRARGGSHCMTCPIQRG